MKKKVNLNASYQPETYEFQDQKLVKEILGKYPPFGKKSAVMPLLDLAQRQVAETGPYGPYPTGGGWIPRAAMDKIAEIIETPKIKVYEVATFYSMYKLAPVGKFLVQLCTTTPCWLCGSSDIVNATQDHLGIKIGETTADGLFTLEEVECLGACVNAPMVQINDDYYEDLTPERIVQILDALRLGKDVPVGSQAGRKGSMALSGPTTLEDLAEKHNIKGAG
mgnify:CR=1 FL=1